MISSESRRGARGTGSLLTLGIKKIAEERKAGRPGQAKKKKKPEKSLKRLKVKTGEIKKKQQQQQVVELFWFYNFSKVWFPALHNVRNKCARSISTVALRPT